MNPLSKFFNKNQHEVTISFWWDDGLGATDYVVTPFTLQEIYAMDKREQEFLIESIIPEVAIYSGVIVESKPEGVELKKVSFKDIHPQFQDLYEIEVEPLF